MNLRGKGLVILSGCGQAGIVNTIHYAKAITGIQWVYAVIGGSHLGPTSFHDRINWVVREFVALEPVITPRLAAPGIWQPLLFIRTDPTHSARTPSVPELPSAPSEQKDAFSLKVL